MVEELKAIWFHNISVLLALNIFLVQTLKFMQTHVQRTGLIQLANVSTWELTMITRTWKKHLQLMKMAFQPTLLKLEEMLFRNLRTMSTDHKKIELPFEGVKPLLTTQMPEGKSGLLREPCLRSTLWLSLQWMEVVQEENFSGV